MAKKGTIEGGSRRENGEEGVAAAPTDAALWKTSSGISINQASERFSWSGNFKIDYFSVRELPDTMSALEGARGVMEKQMQ